MQVVLLPGQGPVKDYGFQASITSSRDVAFIPFIPFSFFLFCRRQRRNEEQLHVKMSFLEPSPSGSASWKCVFQVKTIYLKYTKRLNKNQKPSILLIIPLNIIL